MAGHDRDIAPWRFTKFSRSIRHFERQHSLSKFLQLPSTRSLRVKRRVRPMHSATFARSAGLARGSSVPYSRRSLFADASIAASRAPAQFGKLIAEETEKA